MNETDYMREAWNLASMSCAHTRPNPPVGAVVVREDGVVIGRGRHKYCGADHAEAAALKDCATETPHGSTVYCTLEPCSKPGRVGACCDALIAAGVKKVVWACADPNPTNANKAKTVLGNAGIETECWFDDGIAEHMEMARAIWKSTLRPFAKHVTTGLPFVTVKLAMSLDGKICDDNGKSQWISCRESLETTGAWRLKYDVMLVGAETVRKDNPSLLSHSAPNDDLWRAVVSRSGNIPPQSQIFTDSAKDRTLVYSDAAEAVRDLGKRGFMHVLCEGGLALARSLAAAGLVDEWVSIMCPVVIGNNPLDKAVRFDSSSFTKCGSDVFVTANIKEQF